VIGSARGFWSATFGRGALREVRHAQGDRRYSLAECFINAVADGALEVKRDRSAAPSHAIVRCAVRFVPEPCGLPPRITEYETQSGNVSLWYFSDATREARSLHGETPPQHQ
jgi:hypothetical protein